MRRARFGQVNSRLTEGERRLSGRLLTSLSKSRQMHMLLPFMVLRRSPRIASEFRSAGLTFRALFALIASGIFVVQAQQQPASPNFARVVSLMQERVASGVPSIAIAVAHHGRIVWEEAIGMSDRERRTNATVHTPYYLASISKTITATALLELVDHNKVNLDRPVNDYLHTVKVSSPMWDVSKSTVRRVANHTAGFATYDRDCLASDRDCDASAVAAIRRYGVVVWPPGDRFDYSNLDYGILGEVVAQASHASLAMYLQRNVFAPLGMTDCFLDASADRRNSAAARYDSSPPFSRTPIALIVSV